MASKSDDVTATVLDKDQSFKTRDQQRQQLQSALAAGSFLFQETGTDLDAGLAGVPLAPSRASVDSFPPAAGPSVAGPIGTAVAIYDYNSGTDIDLVLKEGDKVILLEKVETWYKGFVDGLPDTIGFFPSNFVELSGAEAPQRSQPVENSGVGDSWDNTQQKRTLWVGGIPEKQADEAKLIRLFSKYGPVDNITVRVKPAETHGPNKSWSFVSFVADAGASVCLKAVTSEGVSLPDADGEQVMLRIKAPDLQTELSKPSTGALSKVFDAHKSLLGAAMKADLNQSADGVHAGITMGEIEKALELVPTGQKGSSNGGSADSAQNILSESFSQRVSGDKTQELSRKQMLSSSSFTNIKQMSKDFEKRNSPFNSADEQHPKDEKSSPPDARDGP